MDRKLLTTLTLCASLSAHADDLRSDAINAQWADVGSTAIGLSLGAVEANPLGILILPAKVWAVHHIDGLPEAEQPAAWASLSAVTWGAVANNLCVIGVILSSGSSAALCPILGLGTGFWHWQQNKPTAAD